MSEPIEPRRLDLRGLRCPLPVLKLRKALALAAPGETILAIADDPVSLIDVPNAVREHGDELIETTREGRAATFAIRKRG